MSYEFQGFAQQGWQCPICKRVYSPMTPMCWYCGGNVATTTSTQVKNNDFKSVIDKYDRDSTTNKLKE